MESQPEIFYTCKNCHRDFKYKTQYSEHIVSCEFLKGRAKERNTNLELEDDDIPNTRMMYELVKNLALKCQNLENKVAELQRTARRDKRKIDVIQYLNAHQKPEITYKKWQKSLEVKQTHLDATIEGNIILGVCRLVQDSIMTSSNLPIAAFSHKHNIFYMYEPKGQDDLWTMMNEDVVNRMFDTMSNRILKTYNNLDKHDDAETEETQNKKNYYKSKILGLSICDDTKYRRFTNWLFNHLKKNIKGITEYEFD